MTEGRELHGHGAGGRLVRGLLALATERGEVTVFSSLAAAGVWGRLGLARVRESCWEGEHAVVMTRRVPA